MKFLCDRCVGDKAECPYPQENHCEYFEEKEKEMKQFRIVVSTMVEADIIVTTETE